ncbi:hypothetical protein Desaci_4664 [Desulfosporosinus acidiphilus SJ4]|uniref:Uncharacterized protein n=1 Tax=Desulfosporosinus acidiphilus (strain DSM 22704 / JCM 16185 / SJ4) TaxID=646529 RepID=I4DCH5_DESAJ|nr:hypothetical protein Desaci_4664 [Desulfosporosinus acidiphilus SJ4]
MPPVFLLWPERIIRLITLPKHQFTKAAKRPLVTTISGRAYRHTATFDAYSCSVD